MGFAPIKKYKFSPLAIASSLLPGEISVDNFAGGGGASTGMELGIGRHVDIAINHDPASISMHKLNHPETKHYCESVWDVDPVKACAGRPVGLAWFSPDCKHFSKAKGGKPVDKNIRGLAWVTVKWCLLVPVRVFHLENVEEFKGWGPLIESEQGKFKPCLVRKGETFDGFVKCLTTGIKPNHPAWREMCSALNIQFDIKAKLKLFKGLGYALDHKVLSACDYGVPTIRKRFFLTARNDGVNIGWPQITHGKKDSGLLPFNTAANSVIDWTLPVTSIFNRKRPLVEKTMARIAKGIKRFVFDNPDPFVVDGNIVPFITEHANGSSQRNMAANEPLRTICAQVKGGHFALVTSHIIKFRGDNAGHRTDEPLHTISAGGNHLGEVRAFLVKYYGNEFGQDVNRPLHTVTTKDRFGLIVVIKGEKYQIIDIGMRMLQPHELFLAHDFPEHYIINKDINGKKVSKKDQVARVGNSVPPTMAKLIVSANQRILVKAAA